VEELRWSGPTPAFAALAARFDTAVTETRRPLPQPNVAQE
jgi:hypothetical protein